MECRSDVHFWHHGRIGDSMIVTDEVLSNDGRTSNVGTNIIHLKCGSGHESAGEVAEVWEGVTQWKAGEDLTHCVAQELLLNIL